MNIKAMMEKRSDLQRELNDMLEAANTEVRALTEEENKRYDEVRAELDALDKTLDKAQEIDRLAARNYLEERSAEDPAIAEEMAFNDYVMGRAMELRSGEQNMDTTNGAALIPTTIANRIIKAVKDRCPILAGSTLYHVKGTLKVPVWGNANSTHNITVDFASDFTPLTPDSGAFTSVDLGGYLAAAETLIGKTIENNAVFSVTEFIVNQMAEEIAQWIEGQLLVGTGSSAPQGATKTTNGITAAATDAVTADELIELQACVKQVYQQNACWTMNRKTFSAIQKLKTGQGVYLLQADFSQGFPYRLLGKPVFISDNMPDMAASAKAILYGDYSGLSVNFQESVNITVLRELYAAQHAIGVIGYLTIDSKVTDHQKLAVLTMKAS